MREEDIPRAVELSKKKQHLQEQMQKLEEVLHQGIAGMQLSSSHRNIDFFFTELGKGTWEKIQKMLVDELKGQIQDYADGIKAL